MPRRPIYPPLNVFINSRLTGQLKRAVSGAVTFKYHHDWLHWAHTFPISFSLPLREEAYSGASVIPVFENLLPDNDLIRQRVAARARAAGTDAYSLLMAIGRDCVGAMQFLPEGIEPGDAGKVECEPISDARIGQVLRDLRRMPLGIDPESDFRLSIAGAQDKTALLYTDGQWRVPKGSTPTTHILKPQIGNTGDFDMTQSVENEHLCMQILGALGFAVASTDIVDFDGVQALVVERFDRQWSRDGRLLRRPQEDMCQALGVPPSRKYQSDGGPGMIDILELLKASDDPAADQFEFIKAQIAFWLLGAIDGHAKNFSIFLHPGGGFRLTPLYDVMTVLHLLEAGRIRRSQAKLAMCAGDHRHYRLNDIQPRHFLQTLSRAGLSHELALKAFREFSDLMPEVVERCCADMADSVPRELADALPRAVRRRIGVLGKWLEGR